MATVFGMPTRFGGELTINRLDMDAIISPQDTVGAKLERIWDHIKDWFCNTNLVEAKQQLSILQDPQASITEKAGSFFKLRDLVGQSYRDRFEVTPEAFGVTMNLNYGEGFTPYNQSIVLCSHEYLLDELEKDIIKAAADPKFLATYHKELVGDLQGQNF